MSATTTAARTRAMTCGTKHTSNPHVSNRDHQGHADRIKSNVLRECLSQKRGTKKWSVWGLALLLCGTRCGKPENGRRGLHKMYLWRKTFVILLF